MIPLRAHYHAHTDRVDSKFSKLRATIWSTSASSEFENVLALLLG